MTQSSVVNVVNSNGNKYLFNGLDNYNLNVRFGLYDGNYVFENIPQNHPMAILNTGLESQISYTGDSNKKLNRMINGVNYDFYYGNISVTVSGDFEEVSVYCYYHGYMGGEDLLVYSSECAFSTRTRART